MRVGMKKTLLPASFLLHALVRALEIRDDDVTLDILEPLDKQQVGVSQQQTAQKKQQTLKMKIAFYGDNTATCVCFFSPESIN